MTKGEITVEQFCNELVEKHTVKGKLQPSALVSEVLEIAGYTQDSAVHKGGKK